MPLLHSKSKGAFSKNVSSEMESGHPLKQSLAIAYAMKRRAKKMASGGDVDMQEDSPSPYQDKLIKGMKKAFGSYADGGVVEEEASGYEDMPIEHPKDNGAADTEDEDMISRIMKQRYSKGGMVANDTPVVADFEENDFDDLVLRDDLEGSYTGANSGDEIGDHMQEARDKDLVSKIMRSRAKKDRMPRPA